MKKIFAFLFAVLILLCLCSCKETKKVNKTAESIDVDLTRLSSTMVYSEVSNMMINPSKYIGKTVKMNGQFAVYEGENKNYYACVIADATACCQQGIEFRLKDERNYPSEYPELGADITVEGIFSTYKEGNQMFLELISAELL